jgi:hypothetical protein
MFHNTDAFTLSPCCSRDVIASGCPVGNVYVLGVIAEPADPMLDGYYLVANTPTVDSAFDGHANEYVKLVGGQYVFCTPTDGDHVTIYGQCAVLCYDNGGFGEFSPAFTGAINNVGSAGIGVLIDWTGNTLNGRKIVGSGATTVTQHPDGHLVINSPAYVPIGQNNNGLNVGLGIPVYGGMSGVNLKVRSLLAEDSSVTLTLDGDTIKFRANLPAYQPSQGQNIVGGTIPVFSGMSGINLQFFQLSVDTEWASVFDVTAETDRIEFHFTPSGHSFDIFADTSDLYSSPAAQNNVMMWDSVLQWVNRPISLVNLGTAPVGSAQIYSSRSGLTFNLRELLPGTGMSFTQNANTITLNSSGGAYAMANLGAGIGIWNGVAGTTFSVKSLKGSADIFLSATATEITIEGRELLAGDGVDVTLGATDATFSVPNWSTLLSDAAAGDASLIKSGPPWLLRVLNGGVGINVTQAANTVTFDHALLFSSLGGGVDFVDGWTGATLEAPTAEAGSGMDIQRVGNKVIFSVTSGGASGAGVSGTALVGAFVNSTVTVPLSAFALTATTVKFPSTALSVTTITKNGANEEFTFNKAGKWKISAKATLDTGATYGASQTEHQLWCEVDTTGGGTWVEVAGSRSWAYTTNEINDRQTVHTGEFSINVTNLTTKVRFRVITNGGTLAPTLMAGGTMATFEEAVGPIWEVVDDATTARTLTVDDNGKVLQFTSGSAVTVTLPQTMLKSFACDIIQSGAGLVTMQTSGAATIQSTAGASPRTVSAQYGRTRVVAVSGTGANAVYNLSGNIA